MAHKVWFIAIQPEHWGRGENEKQAKANMRRAGGKGKSSVYLAEQDDTKSPPYVDMMGCVCHFAKGLVLVSGKDVLGVNIRPNQPNSPRSGVRSDVPPRPADPATRCANCDGSWGQHNGWFCMNPDEEGEQWSPFIPFEYEDDGMPDDDGEDNPF